jgi:hypothetical protein
MQFHIYKGNLIISCLLQSQKLQFGLNRMKNLFTIEKIL